MRELTFDEIDCVNGAGFFCAIRDFFVGIAASITRDLVNDTLDILNELF